LRFNPRLTFRDSVFMFLALMLAKTDALIHDCIVVGYRKRNT